MFYYRYTLSIKTTSILSDYVNDPCVVPGEVMNIVNLILNGTSEHYQLTEKLHTFRPPILGLVIPFTAKLVYGLRFRGSAVSDRFGRFRAS